MYKHPLAFFVPARDKTLAVKQSVSLLTKFDPGYIAGVERLNLTTMMEHDAKIYIAGHQGMAGSAIHRRLKAAGYWRFVLQTSSELDLRDQAAVRYFFEVNTPDYVFLAAAKTGGIYAQDVRPAEFMYDNLLIQANIIQQCYHTDVKRLFLIAPSTVYPKNMLDPHKEEDLLKGEPEERYQYEAVAKIAGIKLAEAFNMQYGCEFISLITPDVYGESNVFDPVDAHVVPSLIRRIFDAKVLNRERVEVWGTGVTKREFLHADDLADACVFLMQCDECPERVNIGPGEMLSIQALARYIKEYIGYEGQLYFNPAKPDAHSGKILDSYRLQTMGWTPKIRLTDGLHEVCNHYMKEQSELMAI
jgi:GDP-L-fucose synthase